MSPLTHKDWSQMFDYWLSSSFALFIWKLLLNFFNELQDIIRIPICEASVTNLRSQRQRPVPRKWKCHSYPVSVCELALFLAPAWLGVWLLRVCMRHLINTNPGLNQIWEGTGRYRVVVHPRPAGCRYIAISLYVNMFKGSRLAWSPALDLYLHHLI